MEQVIKYGSHKARQFAESVIREMTRVAAVTGAINLAQGYPDFPAPDIIKQAAVDAVMNDHNQYEITWGAKQLRDAVAWKLARDYDINIDPEENITICCGSTEGMIASLLAMIDPGDEVIIFEPFYENYGADVILCGAVPRYVQLKAPDFEFDFEELAVTFNERTRAIIINTPHNPTGKVFSQTELEFIAGLCNKYDVLAITDEIYEHILYDGARHLPIWKQAGMAERTIMVNSISKTYSVTGWRVGYVVASLEISNSIRKVHDFLTVGAPAPLQIAAANSIRRLVDYYSEIAVFYRQRRDFLYEVLTQAGFECFMPYGAYYIMADIRSKGGENDVDFAMYLTRDIGVAVVPGSSFFRAASPDSRNYIRFCFCKKMETLEAAASRLRKMG